MGLADDIREDIKKNMSTKRGMRVSLVEPLLTATEDLEKQETFEDISKRFLKFCFRFFVIETVAASIQLIVSILTLNTGIGHLWAVILPVIGAVCSRTYNQKAWRFLVLPVVCVFVHALLGLLYAIIFRHGFGGLFGMAIGTVQLISSFLQGVAVLRLYMADDFIEMVKRGFFLNVVIKNKDDAVSGKVEEMVHAKLEAKGLDGGFLSRALCSLATKMATRRCSEEDFAEKISEKMMETMPQKMKEEGGMVVEVSKRFQRNNFFVLELKIQGVDLNHLITTKAGHEKARQLREWLAPYPSLQKELTRAMLPMIATGMMTKLPENMPTQMKEKGGVELEIQACTATEEGPLLFDMLQKLDEYEEEILEAEEEAAWKPGDKLKKAWQVIKDEIARREKEGLWFPGKNFGILRDGLAELMENNDSIFEVLSHVGEKVAQERHRRKEAGEWYVGKKLDDLAEERQRRKDAGEWYAGKRIDEGLEAWQAERERRKEAGEWYAGKKIDEIKAERKRRKEAGEWYAGKRVDEGIEAVKERLGLGDDDGSSDEESDVESEAVAPTVMTVTVPYGWQPGQSLNVQTPAGLLTVQVPVGVAAGGQFQVQVPQQGSSSKQTRKSSKDKSAEAEELRSKINKLQEQNQQLQGELTKFQEFAQSLQSHFQDKKDQWNDMIMRRKEAGLWYPGKFFQERFGQAEESSSEEETEKPDGKPNSGVQSQVLQVTVPASWQPGQALNVSTPAGLMQVKVPPGVHAGMSFQVQVPVVPQGQPKQAPRPERPVAQKPAGEQQSAGNDADKDNDRWYPGKYARQYAQKLFRKDEDDESDDSDDSDDSKIVNANGSNRRASTAQGPRNPPGATILPPGTPGSYGTQPGMSRQPVAYNATQFRPPLPNSGVTTPQMLMQPAGYRQMLPGQVQQVASRPPVVTQRLPVQTRPTERVTSI